MFSSTEQGEKRKTTLKMKPHRVRKPFQVAAGHKYFRSGSPEVWPAKKFNLARVANASLLCFQNYCQLTWAKYNISTFNSRPHFYLRCRSFSKFLLRIWDKTMSKKRRTLFLVFIFFTLRNANVLPKSKLFFSHFSFCEPE